MARNYVKSAKTLNLLAFLLILVPLASNPTLHAQEKPYFITYSQDLEEPGNLEIETKTALGQPADSHRYGATASELEYGVFAWWTTELYLDGRQTSGKNRQSLPVSGWKTAFDP